MADISEQMRDAQLKKFEMFWSSLNNAGRGSIRTSASWWSGLRSAFLEDCVTVDALRNAGAYVHIHNVTNDGDWAIEVTNWREFHTGVFDIIGIKDPREVIADTLKQSATK